MEAGDITLLSGAQITPDRTAVDSAGLQQQKSRPGPSAGLAYTTWLGSHQGVGAEANFGNTNTRLADFASNNWTMNRVSVDGFYIYRWPRRNFTPFMKAGVGTMILISGAAPSHIVVGLDWRMEETASAGFTWRLSPQFGFTAEYQSRFFRNPDFSDHQWHPQRNVLSEPRIGLTWNLHRNPEEQGRWSARPRSGQPVGMSILVRRESRFIARRWNRPGGHGAGGENPAVGQRAARV
jgi:hypothetical protein